MVTKFRNRKTFSTKNRFIGKPTGQIQERVKAVGPNRFGIVSVDCAKQRSKWMFCDFYGRVLIEPTTVEHTSGSLAAMTALIHEVASSETITDSIVAIEMTGIYHRPVQRAFRQAGFDTRIVHPFATKHFLRPLHPGQKTDDYDLEAIFHAAVKGYGLATLPSPPVYQSLQAVSRHRHNLIKQQARLKVQIRRLLHMTMPGINVISASRFAGEAGPIEHDASARAITGRAGLYPSRYQSDEVDHADGSLVRQSNRKLRGAAMLIAENLIKCHPYYRGLSAFWKKTKVDPRDRRVRVASRAMRMVFQLVSGRQVWRGHGVDRESILYKLREFHRVHKSPLQASIADLTAAIAWLPKSSYTEEAKPLQALAGKRHRGVQPIGDLLTPLLIRLGVVRPEEVELSTSEARSSD